MSKTNFPDVYTDERGQFFYSLSLGNDKITGKRIRKRVVSMQKVRNFQPLKKLIVKLLE